MTHKSTSLMLYSRNAINQFIPNGNAVYFLRGIADENSLYPIYYIGRSSNGRFRDLLLEKFYKNEWNDVVYINYIECESDREAKELQKYEITRHRPKYNKEEHSIVNTFISSPTFKFSL
ncbi:hypothetical protein ACFLY9_00005 [Patescibacteria group bacterium]